MAVTLNPALTGQGRTFINTEGAGCGNGYPYLGCYKVDSLEKSLGDVTSIYCPSDESYDQFVEVASIKGADSRWTSTLTGTLTVDTETELEKILRRGCAFNLQVHFGSCERPDDFSSFTSSIVLQDVRLTNYSLSSLTALTPDERAAVSETASISVGSAYRVFPLEFATIPLADFTGINAGITICDSIRCGSLCSSVGSSDGCEKIYIINYNGALPRFYFSVDGGTTWLVRNINLPAHTFTNIQDYDIECVGSELWFTFSDGTTSTVAVVDPEGVEFTVNDFVATTVLNSPNNNIIRDLELGSNNVYAVGQGTTVGSTYIGYFDKNTKALTEIDNGVLSATETFLSVDALSDSIVLVGATGGFVAFSSVQGGFSIDQIEVDGNLVTDDVVDVHLIDDTNWLAATTDNIYCTGNRGVTWSTVLTTGTTGKFTFFDNVLGYYQTTTNIYRTMDGGNSWDSVATLNETLANNILCPTNPNIYYSTLTTSDRFIKGVIS